MVQVVRETTLVGASRATMSFVVRLAFVLVVGHLTCSQGNSLRATCVSLVDYSAVVQGASSYREPTCEVTYYFPKRT
jgi:hypothetical protein